MSPQESFSTQLYRSPPNVLSLVNKGLALFQWKQLEHQQQPPRWLPVGVPRYSLRLRLIEVDQRVSTCYVISNQLYTSILNRSYPPPHSYIRNIPSALINARKRPRSPDSSHPQYPNTRFRPDVPSFVPKKPRPTPPPLSRTQRRKLRPYFPKTIVKKIGTKSDNARIHVARNSVRKRLRLNKKVEEVLLVAETNKIIVTRTFMALCNLYGISTTPREQQQRSIIAAHLHVAPLRYPHIDIPLDSSRAWKLLAKLRVAGRISKQRFKVLIDCHLSRLASI